jgi:ATP-dependent helicase HrpB
MENQCRTVERSLPIFELEKDIIDALVDCPRLILQAPTGSGKSTQVPQILLDSGLAGSDQIVILQPRRLPTRMLAARVAWERDSELGTEVGYQIRLDNIPDSVCYRRRIAPANGERSNASRHIGFDLRRVP